MTLYWGFGNWSDNCIYLPKVFAVIPPSTKYTFSGHESFSCKSLWLKKGYDFILAGNQFTSPDAVVSLGVGKNMVASIRYWMKAFGLTKDDKLLPIARYLLDTAHGRDPYLEDLGTLWLLHYHLVSTGEASLYNLFFVQFQKEKKEFERQHIISFVKRQMTERGKLHLYNENTVKKDVGVLLLNYVSPFKASNLEDFSVLLLDLDLIRTFNNGKLYTFNYEGKRNIPPEIFLYAILQEKAEDSSVDYDTLQKVGLMFCMTDMEVIALLLLLQERYKDSLRFSDTAGVRQLQFLQPLEPIKILNLYYATHDDI